MWYNFEFEGALFQSDPRHNDRVDCLCKPIGFTSFRAQVKGLMCPKSGTAFRAHEYTTEYLWCSRCSIFIVLCWFCRSMFVVFVVFHLTMALSFHLTMALSFHSSIYVFRLPLWYLLAVLGRIAETWCTLKCASHEYKVCHSNITCTEWIRILSFVLFFCFCFLFVLFCFVLFLVFLFVCLFVFVVVVFLYTLCFQFSGLSLIDCPFGIL